MITATVIAAAMFLSPPPSAYVEHAYIECLDRLPNEAEVSYWEKIPNAREMICDSFEARRITTLRAYEIHLGRTPSFKDICYWTQFSSKEIASGIFNSSEARSLR